MNEQPKSVMVPAIKKETTDALTIKQALGSMKLSPENMSQAMEVAKMMSVSGVAIPIGLRNNAGACLGVAMKAWNWGMEPYSVASKVYVVKNKHGNETLAFEGQLVHAVVNARAPLTKRLRVTYDGEGSAMTCKVTGYLNGEKEPFEYETPPMANIPVQNSPLWKADPKQQLNYYAVRAWARRHVPEIIMGVYTPEEIDSTTNTNPATAKDITPPPRPEEGEFEDMTEPEAPAEMEMISQFGEVIGTYNKEGFAKAMCEEAIRLQTINVDKPTFSTFMDNNYPVISLLPADKHREVRELLTSMYKEMEDPPPKQEPAPEPVSEQPADAPEDPNLEPEAPESKATGDQFIQWTTPSGNWDFRSLKELKSYIVSMLNAKPLTVEAYETILESNAATLDDMASFPGWSDDVKEIRGLIQARIDEITQAKGSL